MKIEKQYSKKNYISFNQLAAGDAFSMPDREGEVFMAIDIDHFVNLSSGKLLICGDKDKFSPVKKLNAKIIITE